MAYKNIKIAIYAYEKNAIHPLAIENIVQFSKENHM